MSHQERTSPRPSRRRPPIPSLQLRHHLNPHLRRQRYLVLQNEPSAGSSRDQAPQLGLDEGNALLYPQVLTTRQISDNFRYGTDWNRKILARSNEEFEAKKLDLAERSRTLKDQEAAANLRRHKQEASLMRKFINRAQHSRGTANRHDHHLAEPQEDSAGEPQPPVPAASDVQSQTLTPLHRCRRRRGIPMNLSDSDSDIPMAITRSARGRHGRPAKRSSPITVPSSPGETASRCPASEPPSSSGSFPRPARARKRRLSSTPSSGGSPPAQPPKRKRQSDAISSSVQHTPPASSSAAREVHDIPPNNQHTPGLPEVQPRRQHLPSSIRSHSHYPPLQAPYILNIQQSSPDHDPPATTSQAQSNIFKQQPLSHSVTASALPAHADSQKGTEVATTSAYKMQPARSTSPQTVANTRLVEQNTSKSQSPPSPATFPKGISTSQQEANPKDSPPIMTADTKHPETASPTRAATTEQSLTPPQALVTCTAAVSSTLPVAPNVDGDQPTVSRSPPVFPPTGKPPVPASADHIIAGPPPSPSSQPRGPSSPAPRSSPDSVVCTPSTDFNKRSCLACPPPTSPGPSSPTIVRASTYMREGCVDSYASGGLAAIHLARYSRELRTVPISDRESPPAPPSNSRDDTVQSSSIDYFPSSGADWAHLTI